MQTLEFTANDTTIIIAIDRSALNSLMLGEINTYLQDLIRRSDTLHYTAADLRRLSESERNAILAKQASGDKDYEILDDDHDIIED